MGAVSRPHMRVKGCTKGVLYSVFVTMFLSCVRVRGERTLETSSPIRDIFFLVVVTHHNGIANMPSS